MFFLDVICGCYQINIFFKVVLEIGRVLLTLLLTILNIVKLFFIVVFLCTLLLNYFLFQLFNNVSFWNLWIFLMHLLLSIRAIQEFWHILGSHKIFAIVEHTFNYFKVFNNNLKKSFIIIYNDCGSIVNKIIRNHSSKLI